MLNVVTRVGDSSSPERVDLHPASSRTVAPTGGDPAGFQNLALACDQRFQAAGSYWLISPPRIGRSRIRP
jgi:hypothetical protein